LGMCSLSYKYLSLKDWSPEWNALAGEGFKCTGMYSCRIL
jgi:hypothetical protein